MESRCFGLLYTYEIRTVDICQWGEEATLDTLTLAMANCAVHRAFIDKCLTRHGAPVGVRGKVCGLIRFGV